MKISPIRVVATALTVVVLIVVAAAVIILDPPELQRQRRLDERRTDDLAGLSHQIESYYRANKSMPSDLTVLVKPPGWSAAAVDPVTATAYDYVQLGDGKFQLCAVFSMESVDERRGSDWGHGKGRHCFTRDAAPDRG